MNMNSAHDQERETRNGNIWKNNNNITTTNDYQHYGSLHKFDKVEIFFLT